MAPLVDNAAGCVAELGGGLAHALIRVRVRARVRVRVRVRATGLGLGLGSLSAEAGLPTPSREVEGGGKGRDPVQLPLTTTPYYHPLLPPLTSRR